MRATILLCCASLLVAFACAQQPRCEVPSYGTCVQTTAARAFALQADGAAAMTIEGCAVACFHYDYEFFGLQNARCYCGSNFTYAVKNASLSDCEAVKCPGNKSQSCGAPTRMLYFPLKSAKCVGVKAPYGHGCLDERSKALPFCDTKLSIEQRVNDMVSRLTLDEKLGMMSSDTVHTLSDTCNCGTSGSDRLGITGVPQLVEINSGVSAACVSENVCATVFPGPATLAASFNRSLWLRKGEIASDEMRAFNNFNWRRGYPGAMIGLFAYGPNINIVRDPRFGRNSELPTEDRYLSGEYAVHYVNGMQGSGKPYFKMVAGLKHYGLYTVEAHRDRFIPNVTTFDLHDTYLPQYIAGFDSKRGNAQSVMCSYAGANGVPSCGNDYLLNDVVRKGLNRSDLLVVSDCYAISNFLLNQYAKNNADAAAKAIAVGTDIEIGSQLYAPKANGGSNSLADALAQNLTTTALINRSLARMLTKRFVTGQFDPIEDQPYTKIPISVVNSTSSWDFTLESALQGLVLLKNSEKTLPFAPNKRLAVVGPHILSTRDLLEDYAGDGPCLDATAAAQDFSCVRTIAEVFTTLHGAENTKTAKGVDIDSSNSSGIQEALNIAKEADQVVLCIGVGYTQEHESIDRPIITLPGLQEKFASLILDLGKPTVIVLISGGIVSIDNLIPTSPAIIQGFYPSLRTGEALYKSIFGSSNRWGKLPVTIYPASFMSDYNMTDFNVAKSPGRTYRYYTQKPLFPFGFGLSYSEFTIECNATHTATSSSISCSVYNNGTIHGDEVLMLYHRVSKEIAEKVNHPVPIQSLIEFERVSVAPHTKEQVKKFDIVYAHKLTLTNNEGAQALYPGEHYVVVSNGQSQIEIPIQVNSV